MPVVTSQTEQDEFAPWGRSWTSWFVLLGVLATVVTTIAVGPIAGAGILSLVVIAGGLLRLVLPRAAGLSARSRAFDVTVLLSLGLAIAVLAAVVPQ